MNQKSEQKKKEKIDKSSNSQNVFMVDKVLKTKDEWRVQLTDEQFEIISNFPAWITAAFAIAVFAGALGSLGLLLRKKWAYSLLLISLIAVIVQMGYILSQGQADNIGMTISIILFSVFLVWFSKKSIAKGWIS